MLGCPSSPRVRWAPSVGKGASLGLVVLQLPGPISSSAQNSRERPHLPLAQSCLFGTSWGVNLPRIT